MKKLINKNTISRIVPVLVTTATMATLFMSVAMASGGQIANVINTATSKIYDIIAGVVGGIGIVILAIAAIKYFAGDTREAEEAKKKGIRCVVGSVLVFVLPYAFNALQTWAKGIQF